MLSIITLTTDFGLRDPYVAEMKAVILDICPSVIIVDITHEIANFNIRMGSYVLASATSYFPNGSIHVAVVDPGVGTPRQPIIIKTKRGYFVGPDNGLLILASEKQGITEIRQITNTKLMLPQVSNTFHGRDLFAPAAAHLANDVRITEFGPTIQNVAKPEFTSVARSNTEVIGEILHIDGFGNIITNISSEEIPFPITKDSYCVGINKYRLKTKIANTYGENKPHQPVALFGSHGYFEIAINQGNAAKTFKAKTGDRIKIAKN